MAMTDRWANNQKETKTKIIGGHLPTPPAPVAPRMGRGIIIITVRDWADKQKNTKKTRRQKL